MQLAQGGDSASRDRGASPPIGRRDGLVLLLIVLLGAAVRLFHLDAQSVWYDEAFSVAHSVRPLPELFKILALDAVHPPLHYLVLHGWFLIAGFGAVQARLVSVICGTLSIPLLFLLARRFTDSATSLVAAFLLAISQIGVYFSQEARPYAQTQFLSLLAALAFLSFLQKPNFWRSMSFFAAGTALLYTHYYGAGTLLALGLYWLIFRRDYSPLVFPRLAAVVVLLAIAYVPWVVKLESGGSPNPLKLVQASPSSSQRPSLLSPISALNHFNNGKFDSISEEPSVLQVLLGLAVFTLPAVGALWYTWRGGAQGVILGYLLAALPVGMAILLGAYGVLFRYRHYSFAVPGYYLAVAIGWRVCLRNRAARWTWLAIVVVLSGLALRANQVVTKPDYRAGFLPMAERYRPGDCVTTRPSFWNNRKHLAWEVYYRSRGTWRLVPFDSLPTASMGCERLWVVWDRTDWMNVDKEATEKSRQTIAMLSDSFALVERYDHPAIELQLLQREPGGAGQ
jgi:4-amino-4-deoxy-L-arabinose transferase-like glycosyltransferase